MSPNASAPVKRGLIGSLPSAVEGNPVPSITPESAHRSNGEFHRGSSADPAASNHAPGGERARSARGAGLPVEYSRGNVPLVGHPAGNSK